MKLLTIVIPTYNMEKYIIRCLDSLIMDLNLMEIIEVLIVNDGSRDLSSQIGHEYEKKFPQTFRVIDKNNGNYGSCVNRGLREASGKYFRILDADDTFTKKKLPLFLSELSSVDEDMVVTNYNYIYDNSNSIRKIEANNVIYNNKYKEFDFSVDNDELLSMHALTYKTSVLKNIELKLDEGVSYTDLEYVYFPLCNIKSLIFFNVDLYEYHIGREGQTVDSQSQIKSLDSFYVVSQRLLNDYVGGLCYKSIVLKNNQRTTINKIIYMTFRIALVFSKRNEHSEQVLRKMYSQIMKCDKNILWIKKRTIKPIVQLWAVTGFYFSSFFLVRKLYNVIKG